MTDFSSTAMADTYESAVPRWSALYKLLRNVRGVTMKGSPLPTMGCCPAFVRRASTIVPQLLAAGVQITGRGPSVASFHDVASSVAAAPDDFFCGRTKMQSPPSLASLLALK